MRRLAALLLLILTASSLRAEEGSLLDQARALALRWEETHPDSRQLLIRIFEQADAVRQADRSHKRIEWTSALQFTARGTVYRAEHAYWLARLALNRDGEHTHYAVATLGWVPGKDARTVLLALSEIGCTRSGAVHFALAERARIFPEERVALLEVAADLPPTDTRRCALLHALLGLPEGRPPREKIVLENSVVRAITATLMELAGAEAPPSRKAEALCQSLAYAARSEWGPPLARLVERHPKLLKSLDRTLAFCGAPVDRAFLWSRLGGGYEDRHVIDLLSRDLGPADREHLLAALAPHRWRETGFYLRVGLLRQAPMALLDDAVHEALWRIAETGASTAGLNVAPDTAVEVIARYEDPADTKRLDRLIATGPVDASSEALRVLLRRSQDPLGLFLSQLDHEEAPRRYVAATMLVVDFQSSTRLPLPRNIGNWRKFGEVLQRRVFNEDDKKLRRRELEALRAVNAPSPLSPMHGRTLEDDRALAAFCARLVRQSPDPYTKSRAADLLYWSRAREALQLLMRLAEDEDPQVAKTATRAAEQVRSRLPD